MDDKPRDDQVLNGWKEIAKYLGVSVRTAQMLERRQALPIRRGPGLKAPVFAIPTELDGWQTPALPKKINLVSPVPPPARPSRRHWLHNVLGGTASLVSGAILGYSLPRMIKNDDVPSSYRVEGAALIVSGKNGECWRHIFPEQLEPQWADREPRCVFADVDDDGKLETIFHYIPAGISLDSKRSLVCFDSEGRPRWEFRTRKSIIGQGGNEIVPPFWPGYFRIVRPKKQKMAKIVVSSYHKWSFPGQLSVINGRSGALISEYWHRGHILHLATGDIDGDGDPEVLAGGVNDAPEHKCATLLVFSINQVSGSSRDPQGKPYFRGMGPGTEKNIIFFPRTALSEREEFNRVREINIDLGRITVCVAEGASELAPTIIYDFDYRLNLTDVLLSGEFHRAYCELQKSERSKQETPLEIVEKVKKGVKVI